MQSCTICMILESNDGKLITESFRGRRKAVSKSMEMQSSALQHRHPSRDFERGIRQKKHWSAGYLKRIPPFYCATVSMDPYVWQLCERGHGKRMGETNEKLLMEELLNGGACGSNFIWWILYYSPMIQDRLWTSRCRIQHNQWFYWLCFVAGVPRRGTQGFEEILGKRSQPLLTPLHMVFFLNEEISWDIPAQSISIQTGEEVVLHARYLILASAVFLVMSFTLL